MHFFFDDRSLYGLMFAYYLHFKLVGIGMLWRYFPFKFAILAKIYLLWCDMQRDLVVVCMEKGRDEISSYKRGKTLLIRQLFCNFGKKWSSKKFDLLNSFNQVCICLSSILTLLVLNDFFQSISNVLGSYFKIQTYVDEQ